METKVIKVNPEVIDPAKIKKVATSIDTGKLAAFPTETVYGIACRVTSGSLAKLDELKGRTPDKYYTLHIDSQSSLKHYVPQIGIRTKKLLDNAWPGPLTIVFELSQADIDTQQHRVEKEIFDNLYRNNSIGIRCPANPIATALIRSTKHPIVAPSANLTGTQAPTNAEEVLAQFNNRIDFLIDGGPCKYKKSSTVVKIGKNGELRLLRDGVYTLENLEEMSKLKILFICTGNTCRSPIAVGLFGKYLAEKIGCKLDELEEKGYKIASAGTLGIVGFPASPESITACAARGVDISNHRSSALTAPLINESDLIFAMTSEHCAHVSALVPAAANKCSLLGQNSEIPDPIGQPQDVYDQCADMIEQAVKKRIGELIK